MARTSSLTAEQRLAAVNLFEEGLGYRAISSKLGVNGKAIRVSEERFKIWGRAALEDKPTRQVHFFEFKLEVVRQFLQREASAPELALRHRLSSPHSVRRWV